MPKRSIKTRRSKDRNPADGVSAILNDALLATAPHARVRAQPIPIAAADKRMAAPGDPRAELEHWQGVATALSASEEKHRLLIENASESIFIVRDGVICYTNPKMVQLVGYTPEELATTSYTRILATEDRELVRDRHERRIRGDAVPNQYQFRILHKNGATVWVEINVVKIDWEGRPATLCFVRDIEEQKKAEAALRDSQALYHSLVESLPLVIFRKDLQGRFTFGNRRFCELMGRPLEEIVGRTEHAFSPAELAEKYHRDDQHVCQTGVTLEDIEERLGRDGRTMYVQVLKTPVLDAQDRIIGTQGILWDVTARKRAEESLERAREAAERENLEREVTEISARERQRISRDLHDTVGQELTGLGYMAKSLTQKLTVQRRAEADAAGSLVEGIQRTLGAVRNAIRGLTPVAVDANGLMAALQQLALNTQKRCGIDCRFECPRPVPIEDHPTATHLFHIAQEAVSNAVKHSQATRIVVRLADNGRRLTLAVRDDGIGIDTCVETSGGMGLRIMRHRASMIDATFDLQPGTRGGSVVSCTLIHRASPPSKAAQNREKQDTLG